MDLFAICSLLLLSIPTCAALVTGGQPCEFKERNITFCFARQLLEVPHDIQAATTDLSLNNNKISVLRNGCFADLQAMIWLSLGMNNISIIQDDVFSDLPNLQSLDLSVNQLSTLTSRIFFGLYQLIELNIASNPLHEIPADAFVVLPNLKVLDASRINTVSIKLSPYFRNLTQLKVIRLAGNNFALMSVMKEDFKVLENHHLDVLDITSVTYKTFDPIAFLEIGSIQSLLLGNIRISSSSHMEEMFHVFSMLKLQSLRVGLERVTDFPIVLNFNAFPNLSSLMLKIDELKLLKNLSFRALVNLKQLELKWSTIEHIEDEAFIGLDYLEFLGLSYNALTVVPKCAFLTSWCYSLKYLHLNNNRIHTLAPYTFEGLCVLEVLELQENNIVFPYSFVYNVFSGLTELKTLYLGLNGNLRCLFEYIKPLASLQKLYSQNSEIYILEDMNTTSKYFNNLKTLDLSNNEVASSLRDLNPDVFPNIKELVLNNCNFENELVLPQLLHCPSLERLAIAENKLTQIPGSLFVNNTKLTLLELQSNLLSYLDKDVFVHLSKLTRLILSNNKFTNFDATVLSPLHSLDFINLEENPFSCTCAIVDFKSYMTTSSVYFVGGEVYECVTPDHLVGQRILEFNPDCVNHLPLRLSVSLATVTVAFIIASYVCYRKQWPLKYAVFVIKGKIKGYDAINHPDPEEHNMIYDAFVAYSDCDEDQNWVLRHLVPNLEQGDPPEFKLCVDYRNFEVGKAVIENIVDSVHTSCKTILVLTQNFVESEWCYFEMQMAHHRLFDDHRDVIVPILLTNIPNSQYSKLLWRVLCKRPCYKWTDDPRGQVIFWDKLRKALRKPCKINHAAEV